jgi:prevent-host-death family protein
MDTMLMVADFKADFSEVLHKVRNGEEVVLGYGRNREKIAVLVPYEKYRRLTAPKVKRKAGTLAGKGEFIFGPNFKMTDEELLGL